MHCKLATAMPQPRPISRTSVWTWFRGELKNNGWVVSIGPQIQYNVSQKQQKYNIEENLDIVLKDNPDKLEAAPGKLIPILVQAIKDLKKEIDELKKS